MQYRIIAPALVLLILGCAPSRYVELYPFAASVSLQFEQQQALEQSVATVPISGSARVDRLIEMFKRAGCPEEHLRLDNVPVSPTPNVICTLPGKTDRRIIVSTHHIRARGGNGVFDAFAAATESMLDSVAARYRIPDSGEDGASVGQSVRAYLTRLAQRTSA